MLKHRLPVELMDGGKDVWISAMATNLAIAGVVLGMGWAVGFGDFLLVQLPITLLASSIGVWLFYVQHQFEDTYWEREPDWSFHAGALQGSTIFDLPAPLRWFTANIGIHHVHHLVEPDPELPPGRGAARPPRAARGRPPHAARQLQVLPARAMGREAAPPRASARPAPPPRPERPRRLRGPTALMGCRWWRVVA